MTATDEKREPLMSVLPFYKKWKIGDWAGFFTILSIILGGAIWLGALGYGEIVTHIKNQTELESTATAVATMQGWFTTAENDRKGIHNQLDNHTTQLTTIQNQLTSHGGKMEIMQKAIDKILWDAEYNRKMGDESRAARNGQGMNAFVGPPAPPWGDTR